jgi:hypothetical protein
VVNVTSDRSRCLPFFVQVRSHSVARQGTEASPIRDVQLQAIGPPAGESGFPRWMRCIIRGDAEVNRLLRTELSKRSDWWSTKRSHALFNQRVMTWTTRRECQIERELDARLDQASNQEEMSFETNMKLFFLERIRIFWTLTELCAKDVHGTE